MGEMPQWYLIIKAAQYLGVAPWDLTEQPVYWFQWAMAAAEAEKNSEEQRSAAQSRRQAIGS